MTNAMPIFINSLFPFLAENSLDSRAKQLIETARKSIALAEKEMKYADIAFAQTNKDSDNPNLKLAEIAVWHYAQSIKNYSEAVNELEQAKRSSLPAKYKKYVDLKAKRCLEEMAYSNTRKIALGIILRTSR
ncbi:MAG TPA: hypothetical protein VNB22_10415 [Pyrinomonadaceae bacterium]|nr:hypothetical protein [Pyrinomonadaceae bacterium]